MATKQKGQHMITLDIVSLSLSQKKFKNWLHQIVIHMFSKEISHIFVSKSLAKWLLGRFLFPINLVELIEIDLELEEELKWVWEGTFDRDEIVNM